MIKPRYEVRSFDPSNGNDIDGGTVDKFWWRINAKNWCYNLNTTSQILRFTSRFYVLDTKNGEELYR